jgi:hypothetical protein
MVEFALIALTLILFGGVDDWFTRYTGTRFFYWGFTLFLAATGALLASGAPAFSRFPFRNRIKIPWFAFYVLLFAFAVFLRWRVISRWAVSAQDADMLPLIQQGVERFLQGHNPYGRFPPTTLIPWEGWLTYSPGLWMAFLPAFLIGIDFRIWGLFWLGGLVTVHFLYLRKHREPWSVASFLLLALFLIVPKAFNFVRIGHTFPYWFAIACFCFSVLRKNYLAASIWAGIAGLMRILFPPLLILWFIFLWKRETATNFTRNVLITLLIAVGGQLPFFIVDPKAYLYGTIVWYDVAARSNWGARLTNTFGLTGMLYAAGKSEAYRWLGPLVFLLLLALAAKCVRSESDLLIWFGCLLLGISFLTPIPYFYIYFEPFLFFIFGVSGRWSGEAADYGDLADFRKLPAPIA